MNTTGETVVESTREETGWVLALLSDGRWVELPPPSLEQAHFDAQIRDYVRHRWREETGQIPRGSGMATSWDEARYRR
jgi:hypothetical protein